MINRLCATVVFEAPFYKIIFERSESNHYFVAVLNVGPSDPKIVNIYHFILEKWDTLDFSESEISVVDVKAHINPKRLQRMVKKSLRKQVTIGTKAQNAIKMQHDEKKEKKKKLNSKMRQTNRYIQYEKKQQKKRENHKGH
ncbi:YjdF family protein [Lactiplantibacillus plantarum]